MDKDDTEDKALARYLKRREAAKAAELKAQSEELLVKVKKALTKDKNRFFARYAIEQRHENGLEKILVYRGKTASKAMVDPDQLADWMATKPKILTHT